MVVYGTKEVTRGMKTRVEPKDFTDRQSETKINPSKLCTKWQSIKFDDGSNKKWWTGISYRDFNVCIQTKSKRVRLEYSEFFLLILKLISLWSFMKQLMWTITVIEEHSATSELSSMISLLVFSECLGPRTKQRGYFDLFWSFRHLCL